MAKGKNNVFFCQECGYESSKWVGQCPACKAWNTMVEEIVDKKSSVTHRQITEVQVAKLNDVQSSSEKRMDTHIEELNRVLGGGIVPGSLVLVGGDPGIGKSTLLLQTCKSLSDQKIAVLYISGEESLQQIKMRADRIGIFSDEMTLLCETNLDLIQGVIEERKPQVVVIDSIQTMFRENVNSARECFTGTRSHQRADAPSERTGDRYLCRGTCDKRGDGGRPACTGAYGRYGSLF